MKIIKSTEIALKGLFHHKLRTALATLGIVIGVSSVIVMVAVGEGAQRKVISKIQSLGTDLILVTAGQVRIVAGKPRQLGNVSTLQVRDVKAISDSVEGIKMLSPAQIKKMPVKYDLLSTTTNVVGASDAIFQVGNWKSAEGRLFTEEDDRSMQKVAVLGKTVANNLLGTGSNIGAKIRIGNNTFEVIGILERKGSDLLGNDQDDVIYIPINTALRRVFNLTYINNIYIQAANTSVIDHVMSDISVLLRERHRLNGKPDDFTIQNQTEVLKAERNTSRTFTNLLSAVSGISLLTGGAGVFAVMLISIRERTKEIGLRRAVGALKREVLLQFIIESTTLSLTGGLMGIVLGIFISTMISVFTSWSFSIPISATIASFIFSGLMGVLFGVYPAVMASRLDPIEALKTE